MAAAVSQTGDCDYIFKIIVIGDSGVGKSSLTVRLAEDVFYKDYASTIAIDFRMFFMHFMDKRVRLQIWDTAGQERFQAVATAFYRGANGVMLCFDLTNRSSFRNLESWMERVRLQALPGIPCMLVGCKCDDAKGNRQVTREEASAWASSHRMGYIETSAKEKDNVIHAFQQIAFSIFEDMKERGGGGGGGSGGASGAGGQNKGKNGRVDLSDGDRRGRRGDTDGEGSKGCAC